jgi:hypothetical protein
MFHGCVSLKKIKCFIEKKNVKFYVILNNIKKKYNKNLEIIINK